MNEEIYYRALVRDVFGTGVIYSDLLFRDKQDVINHFKINNNLHMLVGLDISNPIKVNRIYEE